MIISQIWLEIILGANCSVEAQFGVIVEYGFVNFLCSWYHLFRKLILKFKFEIWISWPGEIKLSSFGSEWVCTHFAIASFVSFEVSLAFLLTIFLALLFRFRRLRNYNMVVQCFVELARSLSSVVCLVCKWLDSMWDHLWKCPNSICSLGWRLVKILAQFWIIGVRMFV